MKIGLSFVQAGQPVHFEAGISANNPEGVEYHSPGLPRFAATLGKDVIHKQQP
ncbi:MAG TPA: hypothetical protein VKS79_13945 [Gemmataceae bacterium]|nr:hypothetical protein [Gemmataceae bacterium]